MPGWGFSGHNAWWRTGRRLGAGSFEIDVPAGPLAFQLDVPGLGNNQVLLAVAAPAQGRSSLGAAQE